MISRILEIIGLVLGLVQGLLVMLNRRSNWIVYILQMVATCAFSWLNKLYGDVANNAIFVLWGVAGFWLWGRKEVCITTARPIERYVYCAFIFVATIGLGAVLRRTDDPLPLLDAFTTVTALVATYYMVRRVIDTWLLWLVNDIFYVVEYYMLPQRAVLLAALNIAWCVMAVASYVWWRLEQRQQPGVPRQTLVWRTKQP